jgi:Zn-dependent M28 family amino/carboxypeptidase
MPPRTVSDVGPEACELVELRGPVLEEFRLRKFTHAQLLIEEVRSPYADKNVVGRIRGAGTAEHRELAQEVVILSAHYDHIGVRPRPHAAEGADAICNGADDDASGCAALLELAQALASGPKPARTLVFLFTTGEESGGRGSARYLAGPAEPLEHTVADLNLEMLGRPDELVGGAGQLWLTGFELSNLGPAWQAAGLAIHADPRPGESFFTRSDNYAFAVQGVVAQTLSSFGLHREYHTPRDEPDTLDYAHLEAAARVAHAAARGLADGSLRPAWLEGQQPKPLKKRDPKEVRERARDLKEERPPRKDRPKKEGGEDGKDGDDDGGDEDG